MTQNESRESVKTYEIPVTRDDIFRGKRCSCSSCPIALAVSKYLPIENESYLHVSKGVVYEKQAVDIRHGYTIREGVVYHSYLPANAQDFIKRYDDGDPVVPFTFKLDWKDMDNGTNV